METITNSQNTFGATMLDFMDRVPGIIPIILTLLIVGGFLFLG